MKFYKTTDGQIVMEAIASAEEVVPNTTDGAYEKHVPVIEHHSDSVLVKVGSVAHPMLDVGNDLSSDYLVLFRMVYFL